jgi:hypothetical protein
MTVSGMWRHSKTDRYRRFGETYFPMDGCDQTLQSAGIHLDNQTASHSTRPLFKVQRPGSNWYQIFDRPNMVYVERIRKFLTKRKKKNHKSFIAAKISIFLKQSGNLRKLLFWDSHYRPHQSSVSAVWRTGNIFSKCSQSDGQVTSSVSAVSLTDR